MKVEQIYTGCLAEAAYYIESNGEAAIIDPLRETQPYIDKAAENGAKIKYVFETHFHADFVSGHIDLAKKTGAQIVFGPNANPEYEIVVAKDNQDFKIGDVTIRVLHTPGHTMESSTFLLIDENGKDNAIFSGDTLFLGDVGRPDLAVKSDLSKEDLAEHLYDSLRNKIMTLADDVIVYPGHGAGSACGKNMSKETVGTIGEQKATNYALRADMTKEEFIKEVLEGITTPPQYFPKNVMMNKQGYDSFDEVLAKGTMALDIETFEQYAKDALVLDVRTQADFAAGHIKGALFIGLNGGFAPWVGELISDIKQPMILITPEGMEEEAVTRLARVGYDNTLGYLKGGMATWKAAGKAVETVTSIPASEFEAIAQTSEVTILDVRKEGEYLSERLVSAKHQPLSNLSDGLKSLNKDAKYYIHCAGGYRSMIAASILQQNGFTNLVDIQGGFAALKETSLEKTAYVCPSTL